MLSRITFVVHPTLPFRLDLTVWTARRRSGNAVDRWDGHIYRRVLVLHGTPVEIAVEQAGSRLHVCAIGAGRLPPDARLLVTSMLERTLGLRVDLTGFYRFARRDRKLGPLVERFRGVKPPRFPSLFEASMRSPASNSPSRLGSSCSTAWPGSMAWRHRTRVRMRSLFPRSSDRHGSTRSSGSGSVGRRPGP